MALFMAETTVRGNLQSGWAYTPVPAGNNKVGISWPQVLVSYLTRSRRGTKAYGDLSLITGVTQADLDNGSWFEWRWEIEIDPAASNLQNLQTIRDDLNDKEADQIETLRKRLAFYGYVGDSSA